MQIVIANTIRVRYCTSQCLSSRYSHQKITHSEEKGGYGECFVKKVLAHILCELREAFLIIIFGSRQLIVTKVDGRAGAKKKKPKAYDSLMLRSADAHYKLCVHKRNANL